MWRGGVRTRSLLERLRGGASLGARRRRGTAACERALQHEVGERIHGFTVSQVTDIPELSLTAVKLSHDSTGAKYLHLAREDTNNLFRFFTYGNFPLEQHLRQIHEEALSKFEKIKPNTAVPTQKPWDKPREFQITCGPDALAADSSKQTTVGVGFLLPDITDTFEAFTLNLLSSLLISGPNSPFYKALIESGLGTDFSPDVGYNGSTREAYFSVGLQGVAEQDVQAVRDIIDGTIEEVLRKGFEDDQIEALLHKIEIQMKHQSVSFGLTLTSYIAPCWNHDGDPVELLKLGSQVARFRQCLRENPGFLQEKAKRYFKKNPHKLTLSMKPDDKYFEKQTQKETEKLKQKIDSLSLKDKKQIYEKGLELQTQQSKAQDTSCLPALKVSDIEPTIPLTHLEVALAAGETPVQYCAQPTNGVVYFRAFCSLHTLPEDLRPYVPLFCSVLTKLGCGLLDYRQQAQQIELKTGGMAASPHVIPDGTHLDVYEQGVLFSSFCLDRNLPDMMHLWSEIFHSPCFEEEEYFRVLVTMCAQELSNGVPDSGHLYAMVRAGRTLTPAGDLQETFSGMDQVKLMKRMVGMSDVRQVLRKLPRITKHVLNRDNMRCSVNATPQQMSLAEKEVEKFVRNVGRSKAEWKPGHLSVVEKPAPSGSSGSTHISGPRVLRKLITDPTFKPHQMKTHFLLPFPVNHVGECVRTAPYTDPDHASLKVLARLMTAKFLHTEIREKGGAYGAGARLGRDGMFTFYSYRDPHSTETLQSFAKAVDWAKAGRFTQQDIDEAKLSVFASVDAPVPPSDRGLEHFLYGVSDELKQVHRERLFAVSHDSLVAVSDKYLSVGKGTRGLALLGPENAKIAKDPSWIVR
ncbi:presequence protease, mitochondrial isoform X3 [Panthera tigris]|uniref:presequence protease, mitochondrial isoform X3 n=1 Tax=Panthera tigris TaxID=9694 RepID=UPI001C6F7280|nr:presequence protease, mitochondrial isoform X3 [Panthera tigris]